MKTPRYAVVGNSVGHPLIVQDLGPWDRFPTITNAVEELLAGLMEKGLLESGRRLLYYDSENSLDELVLDWNQANGTPKFVGFRPGVDS